MTTDISVGTEAAVTTTAATTEATTATTTTIPEPDDSADVLRWSAYATEASEVSSGVILQVGGIATDAGADTRGWVAGDYANEAIDAWIEASLMLEEWKERPQPVPERAGQCDALATQMFETTLDIADVFSDMAIEGSTDLDLLEQVSADIGSIGDLAEENKACVDRL